ncbi:MAG: RES family NAD+ phosphorylase [Acidobacteria bacterium]|nr:RES family NAD+ phosphorylase [Acidobacteriota bacterium]MYH32098.1 RES family NAD+ phosphorylase [Acidobacteriota bacterium]MYK87867.1 RES family NAD+ phosphorylase [Acidobacteriota bacterium]
MRLYRISRVEHLDDYRGLGASYRAGGRWNEPGIPALYFAETASVAMLEMANYLPSPRLVPTGYRLGIYDISGSPSMERWTLDDLPSGWDRFPYPPTTQRMGSDWLRYRTASLLAVPSTTVPGGLENIVLVSPARLDAASIRLRAVHEHLYNPRAFGSAPAK